MEFQKDWREQVFRDVDHKAERNVACGAGAEICPFGHRFALLVAFAARSFRRHDGISTISKRKIYTHGCDMLIKIQTEQRTYRQKIKS